MKNLTLVVLLLISGAAFSQNTYDIVINNGRVMDPESNFDAIRNVGVKDGKIAIITQNKIRGKQTIDATKLIVSPGFVDAHGHAANIPFAQRLHLRDGVTTAMELEVGAYPIATYYNSLKGKSQTNYGATVSPAGVREKIYNPNYTTTTGTVIQDIFDNHQHANINMGVLTFMPDSTQIQQITEMVEHEIKQGALGIGAPIGYMTAGVTSEEVLNWQRLAGKYGLATFLHGRFSSQAPPTTGILGFEELLTYVAIYGGGLYIHHIHQQSLNETPFALDMLADARKKGLKVTAEVYPYYQGATIAGADYLKPENYQRNMGRTYKDIIEVANNKPLTKERYEELLKTNPTANVIFGGISKEGMLAALAHDGVLVGSDGMPLYKTNGEMAIDWNTPFEGLQGHPRGSGSHAKVLRLTREKELMPWMTAISKMSYMVAKFLQDNGIEDMSNKGRLQVGKDADITIFDPKTVKDNATMTNPGLPSTGIPYVLVNGQIVVKDSKVLPNVFAGQAIRNKTIK